MKCEYKILRPKKNALSSNFIRITMYTLHATTIYIYIYTHTHYRYIYVYIYIY